MVKELIATLSTCTVKNPKFIQFIGNLNYLVRSQQLPKEKLNTRLKLIDNKMFPSLQACYDIFDCLYNFRTKKTALVQNYLKEVEELVISTEDIIEESITTENQLLQEKIRDFEFVS